MKSLTRIKKAFVIIGIVLTIPSLYLVIRTAIFISTGEIVSGEIRSVRSSSSDNGTTYLPTIAYTFGGEELEVESNAGSGNKEKYQKGSKIELVVNPNNPSDAEINATWELWAAPIVIGGLTLLVWLAVLALMRDIIKRKKFIKRMLTSGVPVKSVISRIEDEQISASNSGVRITKTVYRIYAKGKYNGEEREFKSVKIQKHPSGYGVNIGDKVTVYVDPKKPKKTYFDFSHIQFSEDFY